MFLIKSLKNPSSHFNILDFITFNISNTRSSSYLKLRHSVCKSNIQGHFYFHRIPRLWNSLPQIDTSLSIRSIRAQLRHHFWNHFIANFNSNNLCSYHYLCPLTVLSFQSKCNLIILCNDLFICSFSFVAAGSLACRPSVEIYPIKLLSL